jgi:hypothetical protein
MRFPRNIALAAMALLAVPIAGANDGHLEPFTIAISAPSGAVKAGGEIRVHAVLTNISGQAIVERGWPNQARAEVNYTVSVRRKDGKEAPETAYGHAARAHQIAGSVLKVLLKPGEKMEEDTILGEQFDLSVAGEYFVQLSRPASDNPSDGVVKSNEITVTVIP